MNEYLSPIGMVLATDKIAEIRMTAHKLLATILKRFFEAEKHKESMPLTDKLIKELIKDFRDNELRFMRRQRSDLMPFKSFRSLFKSQICCYHVYSSISKYVYTDSK